MIDSKEASFDIAIVGAGLAGVTAAVLLERYGLRVLLLDGSEQYPKSFKAEKIGNDHAAQLRRFNILDWVTPVATPIREQIEAYHGTRIARLPVEHYGIYYHDFINAIRRQIPPRIDFRISKVHRVTTGQHWQHVELDSGTIVAARLVILASGRSIELYKQLGIRKQTISHMHSLSFGFSVARTGNSDFDFDELTYWGDRASLNIPYATFFRIGNIMRANVFGYCHAGDDQILRLRENPVQELNGLMPGLTKVVGEFHASSSVECCPLHLHALEGHYQPGIVVIGDAFRTVCPAAGTGVVKALNDTERLCQEYIPRWFATPGTSVEKISEFYDDPQKAEYDRETLHVSMTARRTALDPGLRWRVRRTMRSLKRSANACRIRWMGNSLGQPS